MIGRDSLDGLVYKVKARKTGHIFAMKLLQRGSYSILEGIKQVKRDLLNCRRLGLHPNIIGFKEVRNKYVLPITS